MTTKMFKCENENCRNDCFLITGLNPHKCPNFTYSKQHEHYKPNWKRVPF